MATTISAVPFNGTKEQEQKLIELIAARLGFEKLSRQLRAVAEARLDNPEVSLKELGQLMDPPLGKSGINHRMRKLEEIAEQLREKNKRAKERADAENMWDFVTVDFGRDAAQRLFWLASGYLFDGAWRHGIFAGPRPDGRRYFVG